MIKKINYLGIFLTLQILLSNVCHSFAMTGGDEPPALTSIVSIAGKILNIAMAMAGIVLVIMIAYGVVKSSLATGDPRGLEGAKQTWSYAIYGFFIVVGAFALIVIISHILGVSLAPSSFLGNISSALNSLLNPR